MKKLLSVLTIILAIVYIASYMCVYTAALMYLILESVGLDPELRSKKMIDTDYLHVYVSVSGIDLFLNPFREYSTEYKQYNNVEDLKERLNNWGELYNPINDKFIKI